MVAEDSTPSIENRIVIRLLNSPLRGCEFLLPSGRTLFLVGASSELAAQDQLPELPVDTLYVPLEQGGVNFEVLIDETDLERVILRELSDGVLEGRPAPFNLPLRVGALALALRPEHLPWSLEVLGYPDSEPTANPIPARRHPWVAIALASLVLILLAGGSYWIWNSPQRQASELNALLGRDSQRFQVLPGRDDVLYVAAANERDSAWARQVIARGDYNRPAQVINPTQENERVASWLADHYPNLAYYRLQFDNMRRPQLWVSRQRAAMSGSARQQLAHSLTAIMPYAERVDIIGLDDATAAHQAEAGLKRQALSFTRSDHADGVTFVIQGALDDGELLRVRRFVDVYYRQWGGRYVQFAVELKDDWLRGRSFRYGDQGYVKMSAGHWYFPKPL
ncbi:PrgH/EprH family type III secretion inner membrane ring protein [Burkholderia ubonensis]|uniref:PrgH/EprH family type III secretion inner membrane ring protein n=1 Tax=Burkholderia ubonensis TaxID=101571 RepID=UPI0007533E05|nr:PrgH/EprH family type III secretion inner membrane ring protein [Burkholderia ubonensis]KVD71653.1 type III secretion system protein PrgH [Burkholderia ubonensis]